MNGDRTRAAETEARRFLAACAALHARIEDEIARSNEPIYARTDGFKESGAVRRASLDLTRALAEMRKP